MSLTSIILERTHNMGSAPWSLNNVDWKHLAFTAAYLAGGAVLTYFGQWAEGQNFGTWSPVIMGLASFAIAIGHKWSAQQ